MTTANAAAIPSSEFLDRIEEPLHLWRKVQVGLYPSSNAIMKALGEMACVLDDRVRKTIEDPGFSLMTDFREEFWLCRAMGTQLTGAGMEDEISFEQLSKAVQKIGGDRCPWEVGPSLRVQYEDQPEGELLHIIMEPFQSHHEEDAVFHLGNSGEGLELFSSSVHGIFFGKDEFVFRHYGAERILN